MNLLLGFLIKKTEIISFDIFDTLIKRDVRIPEDIFIITGEQILGKNCGIKFARKRIEAEEKARTSSATGEISIDDIYHYLKYEKATCDRLKNKEIQIELSKCKQNAKLMPYYEYAIKTGKPVYLISDMYLPQNIIEALLKKCDIIGYKKLYLSNVYSANKSSGLLYKKFLEDNKLTAKSVLHVGDSIKSDFLKGKRMGMKTYLCGNRHRIWRKIKRQLILHS